MHGRLHEALGRADTGEIFQDAEPEDYQPQADAQRLMLYRVSQASNR